jgi:site-specific DNA-methyltransferase (adenine-specific)
VYSKSAKYTFHPLYKEYDKRYLESNKPKYDDFHQKRYITTAAHNAKPNVNPRPNLRYEWNGTTKQWYVNKEKMQKLHDEKRLEYNKNGVPRFKKFIEDMDGIPLNDWFDNIANVQMKEKLDYATQKPVKLLDTLLNLFSNPGDTVLDIFAGSGTVGRSCIRNGRNYVLFDISEKARGIFQDSIATT